MYKSASDRADRNAQLHCVYRQNYFYLMDFLSRGIKELTTCILKDSLPLDSVWPRSCRDCSAQPFFAVVALCHFAATSQPKCEGTGYNI
jgi:hypothetical protein